MSGKIMMKCTMKLLLLIVCVCVSSVCSQTVTAETMTASTMTMMQTTEAATTTIPTTEASTTTKAPGTKATTKATTSLTTTATQPTTKTGPTTMRTKTAMTTNPVTRNTESPVGPPTGTWMVKDDQGGVCMKMQFGARMYIGYQNTSNDYTYAVVDVPTTAVATTSKCTDTGPRNFVLHLFNAATYWYLNFTFSGESKYTLNEVGLAWTVEDTHFKNPKEDNSRVYDYTTNVNFLNNSVPFGRSFTCGKGLNFQTVYTYTYLTDLILQPYADKAEGDFGKSMECSNPSSTNKGLIIGVTVGACALVLVVVAAVGFVVVRSRKSGSEDLQNIINK